MPLPAFSTATDFSRSIEQGLLAWIPLGSTKSCIDESGASDERECIHAEPKSRHGEMTPCCSSAALTSTVISPKRLSAIELENWLRPALLTEPVFMEPAAVGLLTVVRVVQLPLPLSFLAGTAGVAFGSPSVYQPKAELPLAVELSPSRSPCQMHIPTRTPPELLPSKVMRRSPSLRIGTSSLPLSKVPGSRLSSNDTFALPEPSRRSNAP